MKVNLEAKKPPGIEADKIKKMLFLFEFNGGTCRSVAKAISWSKSKVQEIHHKCEEAGLHYADAEAMSEDELARILGFENQARQVIEVPNEYWEMVCRKICGNKNYTLHYIWTEDYSKENPQGLGYSQFCRRYKQWSEVAKVEIILPQERVPGREIFIDWVGDTIEIYDEGVTAIRKVYFFISTIGDSSYPYVEAFLQMRQSEWVQAHIHMLEFYGGVPRLWVCDNTKTAVINRTVYDPDLNHAYRDLAAHYGIGITPARVLAPKDKGSVEAGVKMVERELLTWLSESPKVYMDLGELNRDIRERMAKLSDRPFKNRTGTRRSVFEALDKPELRPLPKDRFLFFETVTKKSLPTNWHFDIKEKGKDTFYYSFPYIYVRQEGYAHLYPDKVEIYVKGVGRVAIHERRNMGKRYVTNIDHAPENQQERMKFNMRTGKYYRNKAALIGVYTMKVVDAILKSGPVEEQGYKSCDGLLRMSQTYGDHALEEACKRALESGRPNYTGVKNFLEKKKQKDDDGWVPPWNRDHENLRHNTED